MKLESQQNVIQVKTIIEIFILFFSYFKLILFEVNFNVLNINVSECKDTDNGAKDEENHGCVWYSLSEDSVNVGSCGEYDDDDFKAHKMCCACKDSSKCF